MKSPYLPSIIVFSLALSGVHAADDPVTSVQRSLKHLGFYYGETTGAVDDVTRNALKRFQIRHGLKVTGDTDSETLQALAGASTATSPVGGAQQVPPSARERATRTEIADREFLGSIEAAERGDEPDSAPNGTSPVAPPTPAPRPQIVRSPANAIRSPERSTGELSPEQAAAFVQSYLKAAESRRPDEEISFFADQVEYFDSGRVSRQFVAQDQASYYRRWPNREFTLVGPPQVVSSNGARATVRFRIRYKVSSSEERASGATENILRLQQGSEGLKIVGIQERKFRE